MRLNTVEIEVVHRSITELDVEVVVNAANATLAGGGGVDGAIHRAAGPELKAACLAFPQLRPGVRCEVGEVRVTPGFGLKAKHVIHTVGPVWHGGEQGEAELLARCYRNSLAALETIGATSVAFPAISTGAFGYPAHEAADIAVAEVRRLAEGAKREVRIVFACFGVAMTKTYARALGRAP